MGLICDKLTLDKMTDTEVEIESKKFNDFRHKYWDIYHTSKDRNKKRQAWQILCETEPEYQFWKNYLFERFS